jgi:S1-C subfamily serine protease
VEEDPLDQAEESPRRAPSWWRRKAVLVPAGVIVAVAAVAIVAFVIITPDRRPSVVAPAGSLEAGPMAAAAQKSLLRIHSEMPGCNQYNDSTGFVVAPNRVVSRAHDVAGAQTVEVADGQTKYAAHVVFFDPNEDVAILEVPGLPTAAMEFDTEEARPETHALVLGYQDGGDLTTTTARITETIHLNGPNIYKSETVDREVYILKGPVSQGGPLVGADGRVLGIVFGTSVQDRETGFALTAKELVAKMPQVGTAEAVPTGACIEIG